jgi:hypothetical protein
MKYVYNENCRRHNLLVLYTVNSTIFVNKYIQRKATTHPKERLMSRVSYDLLVSTAVILSSVAEI